MSKVIQKPEVLNLRCINHQWLRQISIKLLFDPLFYWLEVIIVIQLIQAHKRGGNEVVSSFFLKKQVKLRLKRPAER